MLKMSSLSVVPAYWLGKILPYVPTPKKSSRRGKIVFSSVLALIFLFLCVPLKSEKNPYVEEMRTFSPAKQAEEYKKVGPEEVLAYAAFYQSLPNAKQDAALEQIKAEAEVKSSSLTHKAKKYGKVAAEFVPGVSDVGDLISHGQSLYGHWQKFQNDESVNTFLLALDSTGLVLDIAGFMPANQTVTKPAKKAMTPIRKAWAKIKPEVKEYIFKLFKPVFAAISRSGLMDFTSSELAHPTALYNAKKDQFNQVKMLTKAAFDNLGPILVLSVKNEPLAEVVMLNSTSPEEVEANLKLANELTNEYMDILKFGGPEAFRAAVRLKERGELDPQVLKAAMSYGPAGLKAIGHVPSSDILKGDFSSRRAYSWLQILLLVLYIPYFCLAMIKIWRPELAHAGGVKEA
ncbi:MAG: hypothetical protein HDQ92_04165 [Desulfovibrio sp.]|nr:hypothetical protein [Desulfovibrio sp.]